MIFTKSGNRYKVIHTPWTGTWIVGEHGKAYRRLPGHPTQTLLRPAAGVLAIREDYR